MAQATLTYKDGAFWRGDARLIVMTRGQYGDNAPTHKEVEQAEKEIIAAVHSHADMLAALQNALPWLIKAHNDGAFDGCALPLGGLKAYEQIERAIAKAVQP